MDLSKNRKVLLQFVQSHIKNDYILLDLPYYTNIGDVLIWEATRQLLREIPYKCLYSASIETYKKKKIGEEVIILFMGGGNFGDLWYRHQLFRYRVLKDYPKNRIIQLPQSIYFSDAQKLNDDINIIESHKGAITICTRDKQSYDIVKKNYKKAQPLLLPDMALFFDVKKYSKKNRIRLTEGKGSLFVRRNDKEKKENELILELIAKDAYESDWPTLIKEPKACRILKSTINTLKSWHFSNRIISNYTDLIYKYFLKDCYIKIGIKFLCSYNKIYSTRLHAAILGGLLGKDVYLLDNSYGKCKGVYELWLKEFNNIQLL